MHSITFDHILPQVFAKRDDLQSDVWCNRVVFERGKYYLLQADSGQGKSTFCSYVIGYRNDYTGHISFDERDVLSFKQSDWVDVRKLHVSYLFQELRLFPELTALENVEIKNSLTGHKSKQQIMAWFEQLGIADKVNEKVALMSFGQQQRVALMRALAQPFDFILADEPISHLDDGNALIMGDVMMDEVKAQGAGIIATSIGKHIPLPYDQIIKL